MCVPHNSILQQSTHRRCHQRAHWLWVITFFVASFHESISQICRLLWVPQKSSHQTWLLARNKAVMQIVAKLVNLHGGRLGLSPLDHQVEQQGQSMLLCLFFHRLDTNCSQPADTYMDSFHIWCRLNHLPFLRTQVVPQ